MRNAEAVRLLVDLLRNSIWVQDEERYLTSHERLAIAKAIKALLKLQSFRGGV